MKKSGFTLIEILVVIAIIAILAAILFPVFASAREKARQTTCSSNEKQIGLGILEYCQDFDETMPYEMDSSGVAWSGIVENYISTRGIQQVGIYVCPSAKDKEASCEKWGNSPYNASGVYTGCNGNGSTLTYAANEVLSWSASQTVFTYQSNLSILSQFDMPAQTIMVGDAWVAMGSGGQGNEVLNITNLQTTPPSFGQTGSSYAPPPTAGNTQGGAYVFRHSGGANFLFADGHVKWMTMPQVLGGAQVKVSGWNYPYLLCRNHA